MFEESEIHQSPSLNWNKASIYSNCSTLCFLMSSRCRREKRIVIKKNGCKWSRKCLRHTTDESVKKEKNSKKSLEMREKVSHDVMMLMTMIMSFFLGRNGSSGVFLPRCNFLTFSPLTFCSVLLSCVLMCTFHTRGIRMRTRHGI